LITFGCKNNAISFEGDRKVTTIKQKLLSEIEFLPDESLKELLDYTSFSVSCISQQKEDSSLRSE